MRAEAIGDGAWTGAILKQARDRQKPPQSSETGPEPPKPPGNNPGRPDANPGSTLLYSAEPSRTGLNRSEPPGTLPKCDRPATGTSSC